MLALPLSFSHRLMVELFLRSPWKKTSNTFAMTQYENSRKNKEAEQYALSSLMEMTLITVKGDLLTIHDGMERDVFFVKAGFYFRGPGQAKQDVLALGRGFFKIIKD